MNVRSLPRKPPEPLQGARLVKHFKLHQKMLFERAQIAGGLSSVTTGNAREWSIQEFLVDHLPGNLRIASGHILFEDEPNPQIDLIVARNDSLALPLGSTGLFFPKGLIACIEIKSILDDKGLAEAGKRFQMLSSDVLKVVFAYQLKNRGQYRRVVGGWATRLETRSLPDLVIILDNSAIIRGRGLRCLTDAGLGDTCENTLYKYGGRTEHKWLPLALLVFEIAQRGSEAPWGQYLKEHLPPAASLSSLREAGSLEADHAS